MKGHSIIKNYEFQNIMFYLHSSILKKLHVFAYGQIRSFYSIELAELRSMSRISIKFEGKINLENMNS